MWLKSPAEALSHVFKNRKWKKKEKESVMLLQKSDYYLSGTVVAESLSMCTSFTKCNFIYLLQTLFLFFLGVIKLCHTVKAVLL